MKYFLFTASLFALLVLLLTFDTAEGTLDFLFSGLNLRRFLPVNPQDTSDGRFATFDGPVRGLPAGHGGGQFGAADCLLCPEGQ